MTFFVYTVSVSNTFPTQSIYLPMVNLYFMLGVSYTLSAYIWFIVCNDFYVKNYFPKFLSAKILKRIWFWKFDAVPFWKLCSCYTKSEYLVKKINETAKISGPEINRELSLPKKKSARKCALCDVCEKCQKDKEKYKEKKKTKEYNESNISELNHFATVILILTELTCNLTVWLFVSDPPRGY